MSIYKKLAGQTLIYGLSSIVGRLANYLLVPFHTNIFLKGQFGIITEIYAYAGILMILLTYGMETSFFRFSSKEDPRKVFSSALWSILITSSFFFGLSYLFLDSISEFLLYEQHPEYLLMLAGIMALDAICAIPFAKLRHDSKPMYFAGIKLINISVNVGLNLLYYVIPYVLHGTKNQDISKVFEFNLYASLTSFVLLSPQFRDLSNGIQFRLLKKMLAYAAPLAIAGLGGIINEMLDRSLLKRLLPYSIQQNTEMLGVYGAVYKLSVLMNLFSQAFRYAAEPFYFRTAEDRNSPQVYANILKYFSYVGSFVFLGIMLFLDQVKYFIGSDFHEGLHVLPILLMANLFLALQVNLAIWYKIKDKTMIGAYISIMAAVITIILNFMWIPKFGYVGSAWATLISYVFLCVITYLWGKKALPDSL